MDTGILPLIGGFLLFAAVSAFFSASGTAFTSLNKARLKNLAFGGNMKAEKAVALSEDEDKLLSGIVIGSDLADVAAASLATLLLIRLGSQPGTLLLVAAIAIAALLFAKMTANFLAREASERMVMQVTPLLKVFCTLLAPLNALFLAWKKFLVKRLKPDTEAALIEQELISMVDEAQSEGDMDVHEGELIRSAIEFYDMYARDILTPRVDVVGLDAECAMEEAAAAFREHGYSRLPVYRETMDNIIGVLHEKDYYTGLHEGKKSIELLMKPAVFAPSTLQISKLLRLLQTSKTHMAVILDEFGGTEGVVTLEDVLEELVGEIYDEHDDVMVAVQQQEDGSLLVDGSMELEDIMKLIPVSKAYEADTVGGWVAEEMGCIPKAGEGFEIEGIRVEATRVIKRRVQQVRIILQGNSREEKTLLQG